MARSTRAGASNAGPKARLAAFAAAGTALLLTVTALAFWQVAASRPPQAMVAAANPLAVAAGLEILEQGGSALDAAIAAQLVLGLVEPQSSGIGGGAFMLHYNAANGTVAAYDGRETAPAAARGDLFLDAQGEPLAFFDAVVGGRAVGVPGLLRMLELAHRQHGALAWRRLFAPAIELAEQGFPVSPRLHRLLTEEEYLREDAGARAYFYDPAGQPWPVGHRLANHAYARTLRAVALGGADAFYRGALAEAIVAEVREHPGNPGLLTEADLAAYEAKARTPLCRPYRQWRVCGMPPPTSGGTTMLQMLGLLSHFDLAGLEPGSVPAVHLISEAARLAYADRALYLADADFVRVPVDALLDPAYLAERARAISPARSMGTAEAGRPPGVRTALAPDGGAEGASTSHLSIVDAAGNAVSMTTSIENAFGSRQFVGGFLLNNQLTDFSFRPEREGRQVANRVEGGKRPRSSMNPTLVFGRDVAPFLAIGSPGGSRIINYVTLSLIAVLDWGMTVQEAIALPRHSNRNGPVELEEGTVLQALQAPLRRLGHEVTIRRLTSGLHGVARRQSGLEGGADPRREGVASGPAAAD